MIDIGDIGFLEVQFTRRDKAIEIVNIVHHLYIAQVVFLGKHLIADWARDKQDGCTGSFDEFGVFTDEFFRLLCTSSEEERSSAA